MASSLFHNQNPQVNRNPINDVMDLINKSGKSPEQLVREICNERGLNVNEVLQNAQILKGKR